MVRVYLWLQAVQMYCQEHSDLPGLHPESKEGNWNMVTVRTGQSDVMVIIHMNVQGLQDPQVSAASNETLICGKFRLAV